MASNDDGAEDRSPAEGTIREDGTRADGTRSSGRRPTVMVVHRVGAVVVAVVIAAFGVLGFIGGLGFFDTEGTNTFIGLSSNGALSTISIVTAVVLIAAAIRGGRLASTIMMVIGVLFLLSAFGNLATLGTSYNLLAFRLPNVFFSIGAGLILLFLGAYGRVSSKLPNDNPYFVERHENDEVDPSEQDGSLRDHVEPHPSTYAEAAADIDMADASRSMAAGVASDEQRRRFEVADQLRTHEDRRQAWMEFDGEGGKDDGDGGDGPAPSRNGSAMA